LTRTLHTFSHMGKILFYVNANDAGLEFILAFFILILVLSDSFD
jgi:hypothetical protein